MSSHADTIRAAIENDYTTVGARLGHQALDALLAENQRYEKALGRIADERYAQRTTAGSRANQIAREALAGDAE